jgi:ABC-type nitrate/sulfonate/bicarbonate transport system substrate-binding protein
MGKKLIAMIMAAIIIGIVLPGCSQQTTANSQSAPPASNAAPTGAAAETDDVTLRYIINNVSDIYPYDFALEMGYFKAEGVNVVEAEGVAGGGTAVIQAIANGSADIGSAAIPAYVNAVKTKTPIKVIYGGPAIAHEENPGYNLLVKKGSGIKTPEDLKGKTIALSARGAMMEYFLLIYLNKAGLSADDVDIIVVPAAQHEQVIESGQAVAAVDGSPIADKMIEDGVAESLTTMYDAIDPELSSMGWGYIINTDVLKAHPIAAKKLVSALIKSDEYVQAHPDEARKVVAKIFEKRGANPELAKYWKPYKLVNHGLWEDSGVEFWLDFMKKNTKTDTSSISPADIYTNEYNPFYKK